MKEKLFDSSTVSNPQEAVEFLGNILESSRAYSIIGKELDGKSLLWNEDARLLYDDDTDVVVSNASSETLHPPEDVTLGKPQEIMQIALREIRIHKDKQHITAASACSNHAKDGIL